MGAKGGIQIKCQPLEVQIDLPFQVSWTVIIRAEILLHGIGVQKIKISKQSPTSLYIVHLKENRI